MSRFWLKHSVILLFCWGISFYWLWFLTQSSNIPVAANNSHLPIIQALPENEFDAFLMTYFDPDNNHKPGYSIRFDKMIVANAKLGLFNTALCKKMTLQNLSICVYSCPDVQKETKNSSTQLADGMSQIRNHLSHQLSSLVIPQRDRHISFPDISKTIQIHINKFRFNWFLNDQSELKIESQTARHTAEKPDRLTLRGAVNINASERIIRSNEIVWDFEKQLFYVPGDYVLTTQNQKYFGHNVFFNSELTVFDSSLETTKKGESICQVSRLRSF